MSIELFSRFYSTGDRANIGGIPPSIFPNSGHNLSQVVASRARSLSLTADPDRPHSGIRVARTYRSSGRGTDVQEATKLDCPPGFYLVTIPLTCGDIALSNGRRRLVDGCAAQGTACVTGPGEQLHIQSRGGCDLIHLAVPARLIDLPRSALRQFGDMVVRDPLFGTIGRLLAEAPSSWLHANADLLSHVALVRLLHLAPRHSSGCLTSWRLNRVRAFIEANIDMPLRLADLAAVAGLSRMHFAAQFRAATGMRPHAFVLSRRIDRAKTLMATADSALVDVALDAGFQSQSHFCAIFKQQTGMTPTSWRNRQVCCRQRLPIASLQ